MRSMSIRQAAANAPLVAALGETGMVAGASTPAAMAERMAVEQRYWQSAIRGTGIRVE